MTSQVQHTTTRLLSRWLMPIVPELYDRSPLTNEELQALEHLGNASRGASGKSNSGSRESFAARKALARLNQPLTDIFCLRHQDRTKIRISSVHLVMHREMYRHGKMFWDWAPDEWMETLCSTPALFDAKYGRMTCCRISIMDVAYLLGGFTDLRLIGLELLVAQAANTYFGEEIVARQCSKVVNVLLGKGYRDSPTNVRLLRQYLSMLFILNRSPYLEDISEELLASIEVGGETMRWIKGKITLGLQLLGILPLEPKENLFAPVTFDSSGMPQEWYAWCLAWYEQAVDVSPRVRQNYLSRLLAVGRWLYKHAPKVRTPEQWTEELALRFRSDLCSWTNGQYGSSRGQRWLRTKGELGKPLQAHGLVRYLVALSRYFSDLSRKPHSVNGEAARRIKLDFIPKEVFTAPDHIRRALDVAAPRDIDLQGWSKLTIAAATLAQSDLPHGSSTPPNCYRAVSRVLGAAARRPNKLAGHRLER